MLGNERRLFPYAAAIERGQDTFSIRYPLYPDIVAHGKTGGDDPQELAEDLFCVILDLAAHGEVDILEPVARKTDFGTNFPVKVTPRLVRYLASYGYKLERRRYDRLVSTRPRVRFTQLVVKKIAAAPGEYQPSAAPMPPRRKRRVERPSLLNHVVAAAEG